MAASDEWKEFVVDTISRYLEVMAPMTLDQCQQTGELFRCGSAGFPETSEHGDAPQSSIVQSRNLGEL